jgi:hypothetical protein
MEAESGETRMRLDAKHESAGRHSRWRMEPSSGCQDYVSPQTLLLVSARMLNFMQATSRVRLATRNRKSGSADRRIGMLHAEVNIIGIAASS